MTTHVAASTPYPWPYDGDLAGRGTALLVLAPAGSAGSVGGLRDDLVATIGRLAAAVRAGGGTVVAATTSPTALRAGRPGWPAPVGADDALDLLPPGAADEALRAGGIDAFYGSDLDLLLRNRGVERVLLAGVGLETCIHSTMRDANDRGYECLLVVDACSPVDASLVPAAVSMIEMSGGIFGAVGRSREVLAALALEGAQS
jgi:nicotinamidase-related amidase